MKVWIDQDLCTGDGLCEEIAPDVFTLLDDGLAYVKEGPTVYATAKGNPQGAEGLANIPESGPVIVANNHLSFADSMVIPIVVPRKVVFLAKEDYFTGTGVKGAVVRGWFEGIGMVPTWTTPQEMGEMIRTELARWRKVVSEAGIKPE